MTIAITPTTFRIPGKGEVTINQLEVRVSSYVLGVSAQAFYDLQNKTVIEHAEGASEIVATSYGLNGNESLTDEQFANWGENDAYFANCIAQNLGLVPVIE